MGKSKIYVIVVDFGRCGYYLRVSNRFCIASRYGYACANKGHDGRIYLQDGISSAADRFFKSEREAIGSFSQFLKNEKGIEGKVYWKTVKPIESTAPQEDFINKTRLL